MSFWKRIFGGSQKQEPRNATQSAGPGKLITTAQELQEAIRGTSYSGSGTLVTPATALQNPTVFACVRLLTGSVGNMPIDVKRRVDARTRNDASDHPLWTVLRRRPNRWQKPAQFIKMMQGHVLLRGNAYAVRVLDIKKNPLALLPLHPDRVEVKQLEDMSLEYLYTRPDGRQVRYAQKEIFHLYGLTLDGIRGVTPITYARETIGEALAMQQHGATVFRNGTRVGGVLRHSGNLSPQAHDRLRTSLEEFRSGGSKEAKDLILEENMAYEKIGMTSADAQWIESRKFSRSDLCMFFGVPPSMIGDNSNSDSNWGTGLEQKKDGYVTFTLEDHLTMWEQAINSDLVPESEPDLYARFNRASLVRGDIKARWEAYVKGLQWGVWSPNEIRALEDENPREGGDVYYDPPNTAGGAAATNNNPDPNN